MNPLDKCRGVAWYCSGLLFACAFLLMQASCRDVPARPPEFTEETETPQGPAKSVMVSALAGRWYPANPEKLNRMLDDYLSNVPDRPLRKLRALILPHAGYAYSGRIAAQGVRHLKGSSFQHVIILGPSHRTAMRNTISLPSATHYATPLGEIALDTECMQKLLAREGFAHVPGAHQQEHSVQIQLPLLQKALGDFTLVPLVVGQLDMAAIKQAAEALSEILTENTLLIASTDFTHYGRAFGYLPFTENVEESLRILDLGAFDFIRRKDVKGFRLYCEKTGATICGHNAVSIMLAMCKPNDAVHLLSYDTSGAMSGDFSHSVSYIAGAVTARR